MHMPVQQAFASGEDDRLARLAIGASLVVACFVLVGKVGAAWVTGSSALLSDALESVIHIAATAVAAFSVWYAQLPPDRTHPYGRERVVYFSAGLEGALISIAALVILGVALRDLVLGPELHRLGFGLLLTSATAAVNLVLGLALVRVGRRTGSIAVEANGEHTLTDVVTSAAVLAGVALVWMTGFVVLDPLIAILAGLHILLTGSRLMRRSFRGLIGAIETADAEALRQALIEVKREKLIEGFHALRFRTEGHTLWAEVHLLMDGRLSLTEAHRRATAVEARMASAIAGHTVHVTSHVEPLRHAHAHPGGHDLQGDLSTEAP